MVDATPEAADVDDDLIEASRSDRSPLLEDAKRERIAAGIEAARAEASTWTTSVDRLALRRRLPRSLG